MPENFQIRDVFSPKAVNEMADRLHKTWPVFDKKKFTKSINPELPKLTYSERLKLITINLEKHLPTDFPKAVEILLSAQLPPYDSDILGNPNERFITVTNTAFISRNGLEHFDISMNALYEMTKRLTAEFDIRIFLDKYPDETLAILKKWAKDKNPHVRRLVSEGSRPFLPWGKRLNNIKDNPMLTLELLELLKNDPSEYVRRSVANHLNDHTKNHPDLIVKTLKKWKKEHPGKNMDRLIKHATRTLIKNGHAGALELLGFERGAAAVVKKLAVDKKIKIGGYLNFSFNIVSTGNKLQNLIVDYIIYFKKSDGSLSPKVFKMTTKKISKKETISLSKRHSFKIITTRVYYMGKHQLAIQINGEEKSKTDFTLEKS